MSRSQFSRPLRTAALVFLIGAIGAAVPALANAATFHVNTTADAAPKAGECEGVLGDCSLRQAIDRANNLPTKNEAATILLPAGHYRLTISGAGEDEDKTGDLDVLKPKRLRIAGAGARQTVIDASGLGDRVFEVNDEEGEFDLSGLTVTGGTSAGLGGGIYLIHAGFLFDEVAIRGNTAEEGNGDGGGLSASFAEGSIVDSEISGNRAALLGGGIYGAFAAIEVTSSSIADNAVTTSLYPGEPNVGASGGAVDGAFTKLFLDNATVAGNSITDDNGGAPSGSGSAIAGGFGEFFSTGSIVADNTATNVSSPAQCSEVVVTSTGPNLESAPVGGASRCFESPGNLVADPRLGPLADNGGETDTLALAAGSPAINAASLDTCPPTDQRGVSRPQLGGCDMGAFELTQPAKQPETPAPTAPKAPAAPPEIRRPAIAKGGSPTIKKVGSSFVVTPGFVVFCPTGAADCSGALTATTKAAAKPKKAARSSAKSKALVAGKLSFSVPAGNSLTPSFKLTSKAASQLRAAGHLLTAIELVSKSGAGESVTANATTNLRLARKTK